MTEQWLRKVNLLVGSGKEQIDLSNMRIRFFVRQWDVQQPNNAEIIVTNLSRDTANKVKEEFKSVILQAGYEGNLATIFEGEVRQVRTGRENPTDTYLNIIAAEGAKGYQWAFVNKTLAGGHTARDQVDACLEALKPYGITAGYIADLGTAKIPYGRSLFGMARDQLRTICQAVNASWSIQGNKLQIVKNSAYVPGSAIVLNSNTGMIGMPVQTLDGIEVRCLLNPEIRPGRRIQIDQASIQRQAIGVQYSAEKTNPLISEIDTDGYYRVIGVDHSGDTRGNPFYTDIICWAWSGKIPPGRTTSRGVPINPEDN